MDPKGSNWVQLEMLTSLRARALLSFKNSISFQAQAQITSDITNNFEAEPEQGSDLEFFTKPSQASPAQTCWQLSLIVIIDHWGHHYHPNPLLSLFYHFIGKFVIYTLLRVWGLQDPRIILLLNLIFVLFFSKLSNHSKNIVNLLLYFWISHLNFNI